ncbi:DUF6779 domain-containing protein [Williamsia sp. CHRR-6]|uniref:DUF6779 domain-containing protein n=1 Tax=Williamsia sp. CHRR-6 TaxID=2835871 RepID=UPI001BDA8785|nr:DUF6779 domain-containing protein [Williamsia sp. CHRR-6]MBT0566138.1 hypothetical protein [Williamsia sp. CHRR-6]
MTSSSARTADSRRVRRGPAQWLLGLLLLLSIGASVALVISGTRNIAASIAVIAALWAAVIGAILVTKFRRAADSAEAKARDLRLVYELQLEREITARRQYELGVEAQIRREVRSETNEELRELKNQVEALRASLQNLMGDLPEQRTALENERLRQIARGFAADGAAAERDFASTEPDTGSTPVPIAEPHQMTEVIPVVTDEAPPVVPATAQFTDDAPTDSWEPISREQAAAAAPPAPARAPEPVAAEPIIDVVEEPLPTQEPPYTGGRHGRGGAVNGQPPAPEPEPVDPGAHVAGRSVADLIQQFGSTGGRGGGRRRRDA